MEAAYEKTLDPIAGSPATGKSVARIINLFVDDLFRTSGNEMEQRVLTRPGKYFQVGPEDWNDVAPKEQRVRSTQDPTNGPYIVVSQDKAIIELEGIPVERNTKEDLHCTPSLQTMYRSSSRTDKLATVQDTVPMSPQIFQMCFVGSFSNIWRCQVTQKTGETDQVTASEASILATHWTIENTWVS